MYLFAGKRRQADVGSCLNKMHSDGRIALRLIEFDIERSETHDLRSNDLWDQITARLRKGRWFLIVSPPCNTFSRARFQWRLHPGPRPLRSRTWPKGFPWLSGLNQAIVNEANEFVLKCLDACSVAVQHGGWFLLEHPEDLGKVHDMRCQAQFGSGMKSTTYSLGAVVSLVRFTNVRLEPPPPNPPD